MISVMSFHNCADPDTELFRSLCTSPERRSFEPTPLRAPSKALICLPSDIRTKMGVVRLRQRKGTKRDRIWPKMGFGGRPGGSDK